MSSKKGRFWMDGFFRLDEADRRIILAIGGDEISVSEMIRRANLSRQSAYTHLERLVGLGLILDKRGGFPKTRLLRLSEEGLRVYEELSRAEAVAGAVPVGLETLRENILKLCQEAASIASIDRLLKGRERPSTIGFITLEPRGIDEKLKRYAEALAEGAKIAVWPKPQSPSEEETVSVAALLLLSSLLSNEEFRRRVSEGGKLTFLLTLDLNKINEPPNVRDQILFWSLARQADKRKT